MSIPSSCVKCCIVSHILALIFVPLRFQSFDIFSHPNISDLRFSSEEDIDEPDNDSQQVAEAMMQLGNIAYFSAPNESGSMEEPQIVQGMQSSSKFSLFKIWKYSIHRSDSF